jgi:hypothetical protein
MLVRVLAVIWLVSTAAVAAAQTMPPSDLPPSPGSPPGSPSQPSPPPTPQPTAEQPGRVFCEQNVTFRLPDPSSVPDQYRRFVGIWSDASWDPRTCAALIVQDVKPDGAASIIYIHGPQGSGSTAPGEVLHGTGVIRDGELRFQNADGSQYAFRPGIVDMAGHWIDPKGESFQATFKQTP